MYSKNTHVHVVITSHKLSTISKTIDRTMHLDLLVKDIKLFISIIKKRYFNNVIESKCFSVLYPFGYSMWRGSTLNELVGFARGVQVAVVYHRTKVGAAAPLTINHR